MNQIQTLRGWGIHTPDDKSNIGGKQPNTYGFLIGGQGPLPDTQALLHVDGPSWATVEAYFLAPVIDSDFLRLKFDLKYSGKNLMLIETDVKRLNGKQCENYSSQRRLDNGNAMEVSDAAGGWVPASITAPPFMPDVWQHHEIAYGRDPKKGYGTELFIFGDQTDVVHPDLQGLEPSDCDWDAGELIQIQITIKELPADVPSAYGYVLIDNVTLVAA